MAWFERDAADWLQTKIVPVKLWLIRHRLRVIVHRIRFPGRAMFSEAAVGELIGKSVVVDIDRVAADGVLVGRDQYYGRIARGSRAEGIVIERSSGGALTFPPDLRPYFGARAGEYRFANTDEVVTNPDLQTTWLQPASADPY
jgi:hypothetical protein